MRVLMIAVTTLVTGLVSVWVTSVTFDSSAVAAQRGPRPWCIRHGGGMMDCTYYTFAQCRASASGVGGTCLPNPALQWGRRR